MKMPIAWHEECLANSQDFLKRKAMELILLQAEVTRKQEELKFYKYQIDLAKSKGKDGFDSARFGFDSRDEDVQ